MAKDPLPRLSKYGMMTRVRWTSEKTLRSKTSCKLYSIYEHLGFSDLNQNPSYELHYLHWGHKPDKDQYSEHPYLKLMIVKFDIKVETNISQMQKCG